MSTMPPGVLRVALREVHWIWRDRAAFVLVVVIPLLGFALLALTFSSSVIRDLRVDIVDQDRTRMSSAYIQAIEAAPSVTVSVRSSDLNAAMRAIRSGDAIATVLLPDGLERDIMGGRRPQIVIFYNKQYFTPGNVAANALQSAVSWVSASLLNPTAARASATPGPIVVEQYVLTNPALNYVQFLLRAVLPTVLHILTAISAGYAVGAEFRSRDFGQWMDDAGQRPMAALVGKLVPYFCAHVLLMMVGLVIIHGVFKIPFRGNSTIVGAAALLLITAYLALGALIQLLTGNLATGLSATSIICSPAFGFAGVGFPVLAMNTFSQAWGSLLPLRWYLQILFDQAARGVPLADSAGPMTALAALAFSFSLLAWVRLRALPGKTNPQHEPASVKPMEAASGITGAFRTECRRILQDRGVFSIIVIAPIAYGILYPQPYVGQLLRDIPIAVVDNDRTEISRSIIEMLDADEAISVAVRPTTLAEAETALARREVFGIVSISQGTAREALKGNPAAIPAFVDSAYFLVYNRTLQGIREATAAVTQSLVSRDARPDGSLSRSALAAKSPVEILSQPLFNPTGGYGSYVVPAAFILILQQTLLMGAATVGGLAYERGGEQARRQRAAPRAVLGHAIAHLALSLPGFALYLIVLPRIYGFSASTHVLDLFAMVVPFVLAVSFCGQFVGAWFKWRETAMLLLVGISMPLFFLVGVAWPPEAIPEALRIASLAFPSTAGIDALVRINQMGASLSDVAANWRALWVLALAYGGLAVAAAWMQSSRKFR